MTKLPHQDLRTLAAYQTQKRAYEEEADRIDAEARADHRRAVELGAEPAAASRETDLFLEVLDFAPRATTKAAWAFKTGMCAEAPLGLPLSLYERRGAFRTRLADLVPAGRKA